jgi:hypothetical protein
VFVDRDKIEQKGDHPDLLLDDSIGRISRELWWSYQFSPVDIIPLFWARHVARVGGRKVYKGLVGKPKGKIPLGRPRRRWQDGITVDVREIGWGGVDWIRLAQDRDRRRAFVNTVMNVWVLTPRILLFR